MGSMNATGAAMTSFSASDSKWFFLEGLPLRLLPRISRKRIGEAEWAPPSQCGLAPIEGRPNHLAKSAGVRRNPHVYAGTGAIRQEKTPTENGRGFIVGGRKGI